MQPRIISMFIFFSRGENLLSRLIARLCGWSHMGFGFRYNNEYSCYFEALFAKGCRGPKPLEHLIAWSRERPGRKLCIVDLSSVPVKDCARKYTLAQTYVGRVGYGELQILAMWAFERFGRKFGLHVPRTTRTVVCSEYGSRILFPDVDLRGNRLFDEVTPGSAWDEIKKNRAAKFTFYGEAV